MSYWLNKKVCITGGAGFIGSNLTKDLVEEGCKVRVVDNLERGKLKYLNPVKDSIEFLNKDIRIQKECEEICEDMDIVFHLASKVGGIGYYLEKPGEVIMQNNMMDSNMLKAVITKGISRYFYASSAHVYPIELQLTPDSRLIKEEDVLPANPSLSYGWAKLFAEKQIEYLNQERSDFKAAIARFIGIYGENQDIDLQKGSVIPVFCRRAIEYPKGKPFVVWGTGRETRAYCYIADAIDAMKKMVEKLDETSLIGPLDIGKNERLSIAEIADHIISISGKKIDIQYDTTKETKIWGQICECSKASRELDGWEAETTITTGLRKSYKYVEKVLTTLTNDN